MASFLCVARVVFLSVLLSVAVADTKCQNPRIRREWRALNDDEQAEWISAVNCLAELPHDSNLAASVPADESLMPPVDPSGSFYDDIVYLHMDLNIEIHATGMFFPWHRYYVKFFEDALISKCNYTGATPYWDWTIDAHDVFNSPFFDNSSHGVGGWGDPNNDYQISTGGFKDVIRAYPTRHHIRRNYTLYPFQDPAFNASPDEQKIMANQSMTKENVDYTVAHFQGNFKGFQGYVESRKGVHPAVHRIVGGDMIGSCPDNTGPPDCNAGATWTPNDPVFFLHHAMVDKVWADWQKRSPKNFYSYGGVGATLDPTQCPTLLSFASEVPGDGLWGHVKVWDVIDIKGDTLCYDYA